MGRSTLLFSAASPGEYKTLGKYWRNGGLIGSVFATPIRLIQAFNRVPKLYGPVEHAVPGQLVVVHPMESSFFQGEVWLTVDWRERHGILWAVLPVLEAARRLVASPQQPTIALKHAFETAKRVEPDSYKVAIDLLRSRAPQVIDWSQVMDLSDDNAPEGADGVTMRRGWVPATYIEAGAQAKCAPQNVAMSTGEGT